MSITLENIRDHAVAEGAVTASITTLGGNVAAVVLTFGGWPEVVVTLDGGQHEAPRGVGEFEVAPAMTDYTQWPDGLDTVPGIRGNVWSTGHVVVTAKSFAREISGRIQACEHEVTSTYMREGNRFEEVCADCWQSLGFSTLPEVMRRSPGSDYVERSNPLIGFPEKKG